MIEADGRLEQLKQKTKDEAFKNSSILASRINKIPPPKIGGQVLEQLKRLTKEVSQSSNCWAITS